MEIAIIAVILTLVLLIAFYIYYSTRPDRVAQRELDEYLERDLSPVELGRFYERYIGYLYETQGHEVLYNGAVSGFEDLGRDLIVYSDTEIHVVQTKCWSKERTIREKHIFQLFGTTTHFKLTSEFSGLQIKPVFFATTGYSGVAKEVAKVLGVEIKGEELNKEYPMIKCNISGSGENYYHLPFDPFYDKVKIDIRKGEFFAKTVKEAVAKGFRRAGT